MTSSDSLGEFIQNYGSIIIAAISGTVLLIAALWRKAFCKAKDEVTLENRIKLLESANNETVKTVQSLTKKQETTDESIHEIREAGLKTIGEINTSIARLEEAYKKLPQRQS